MALSPQYPSLIHRHRYADNGLYPDASFYAAVQAGINHTMAYRRKPVFQRTLPCGAVGGTSGTAWRWYCRTGYGAKRFAVMAVLGLDDLAVAKELVALDPHARHGQVRVSQISCASGHLRVH